MSIKKSAALIASPFILVAAAIAFINLTYKEPALPAGVKGQFLVNHGRTIRYIQAGSGQNLLLIHASPGSIEDFDPIFNDLAKNFRVTAFDRPGHGYSRDPHSIYTLNYNARVAEDVIEDLQLRNVVVVGHSYGAGTALAMAIGNNPNVRALVLIGSPGYKPVNLDRVTRLLGIPYAGRALAVALSPLIGDGMVREKLTLGFKPNEIALAPSDIDLRAKLWTQPIVPYTRGRELANLEKNLVEISRHYGSIMKRVLIIQGKEDWVTKAAWKLHEDILGSKLVVMDGVGHYPHFANPTEVVRLIENFLQDPSPGSVNKPSLKP